MISIGRNAHSEGVGFGVRFRSQSALAACKESRRGQGTGRGSKQERQLLTCRSCVHRNLYLSNVEM